MTDARKKRYTQTKSYSIEHNYRGRRRSIIEDAKFDTFAHKQNEILPTQEEETIDKKYSFIITIENGLSDISQIISSIVDSLSEFGNVSLQAVETRKMDIVQKNYEMYLRFNIELEKSMNLQQFILEKETVFRDKKLSTLISSHPKSLKQIRILKDDTTDLKLERYDSEGRTVGVTVPGGIWIPLWIGDLDHCNHLITHYDPDMDSHHPGFNDTSYRERRDHIAMLAYKYRHGETIPEIEYTDQEKKTWKIIYMELKKLMKTHACEQHVKYFELLEKEAGYSPDKVPQLQKVSEFLHRHSGFRLRPVAGLLTARDFLASLAFRVFQCTQYIRHGSAPLHSPEPDCCHELLGHVPLLADMEFARFSQEIGLASLGASDEDIEKIATLYWFTVEFGLCRENNEIRAYGAGLLSSFGELEHSLSSIPEVKEFEPGETAIQQYQDSEYQSIYFIAENFKDATNRFKDYVKKNIRRPFHVRYDAYRQALQLIDEKELLLKNISTSIQNELETLNEMFSK
ncbi:hypothetical protein SNEBB_003048 [Seison nebaliae]|nr:hypothetical protein SNEBB_003048 [Seison nebaliae]